MLSKNRADLCRSWTIHYGVPVSHDSYVKCCVKAEAMRCNGTPLPGGGGGRKMPKSPSLQVALGLHLDTDMSGTSTLVGYKNPELQPPSTGVWLLQGQAWSPAGLPLRWMHVLTAAAWLETCACLSTCGRCQ